MSEQNPQVVTTPRASTGDEDRSVTIPARPARRREQKPTDLSAASRAVAATPAMPATVTASTGSAVPPAAPSTAVPKHQRLSRRVMFLEQSQEAGLAELTRQVMSDPRRAAVPGSARERISDAVLVRAAIDLLLRDHPAESLGCLTEDDLRASLGLPPLGR